MPAFTFAVRYVLPGAFILAGFVCMLALDGNQAWEGGALFLGGGVSILLLNQLHRFGVAGDADRDHEDAARAHFDEHGEWPPDEPRKRPREWKLPDNIDTPD